MSVNADYDLDSSSINSELEEFDWREDDFIYAPVNQENDDVGGVNVKKRKRMTEEELKEKKRQANAKAKKILKDKNTKSMDVALNALRIIKDYIKNTEREDIDLDDVADTLDEAMDLVKLIKFK